MWEILTAAASYGFEKILSMLQNKKKLPEKTGDTEVLKVAICINYLEDGLNSIMSPSKVPA